MPSPSQFFLIPAALPPTSLFICKQQELPARANLSAAPAPATPTALHAKMDQVEEQLLTKVLALEKERTALSHSSHRQRQEVEKELETLLDRVAELEHGGCWTPQRAWRVKAGSSG